MYAYLRSAPLAEPPSVVPPCSWPPGPPPQSEVKGQPFVIPPPRLLSGQSSIPVLLVVVRLSTRTPQYRVRPRRTGDGWKEGLGVHVA